MGSAVNGVARVGSNTGFGQALSFDGTDDYVQISSKGSNTSAFTIGGWVKSTDNTFYKTFFGEGDSRGSVGTYDWALVGYGVTRNSPASGAGFYFQGSWSGSYFAIDLGSADTNWHYLLGTWDGTTMRGYRDGVLVSSYVPAGSKDGGSSAPFLIGAGTNSSLVKTEFMTGSVDEVRVYNRALSADDVSRLYKLQKPKVAGGTNSNGLVGYWPLDEGSGIRAEDMSTNSNNGTLTNGPTWVVGKNGGALSFSSTSSQYLDIPNESNFDFANTTFTVSEWIKTTQAGLGTLVGKNDRDVNNNGWVSFVNVAGNLNKFAFQLKGSGGVGIERYSNTSVNDGLWHHVVAVVTTDTVTAANNIISIYIDGILDQGSILQVNPYIANNNTVKIGRRDTQDYYDGQMDDVRIYNRGLSAIEIAALYKGSKASVVGKTNKNRITNGLVGYWTMDGKDTYGTQTNDVSGNGNNGTLTNGPVLSMGKIQQSFAFDGTDDYISVSHNSNLVPTADYSLSAWVKTSSSATEQEIITKFDASGSYPGYFLSIGDSTAPNTGKICLWVGDNTGWSCLGTTVNDGTWHFITARVYNTTVEIYRDGVSQGTTVRTPSRSNTGALSIGRRSDTGKYFQGSIDEVRVYTRLLSADEIKALYTMGR